MSTKAFTLIFIVIYCVLQIIYFFLLGPIIPSSDDICFRFPVTADRFDTFSPLGFAYDPVCMYYYGIYVDLKTTNAATTYNPERLALYFHGFNSNADECHLFFQKAMPEFPANLSRGVLGVNLPGASADPEGYANVTCQSIMVAVYRTIQYAIRKDAFKTIDIYASSTGAAYVWWYLQKFGCDKKIKNCVFFSPNIELHPSEAFLTKMALCPGGKKLISFLNRRIYQESEEFDMYQFVHLIGIMGIMRRIRFNNIENPPALIVYYIKPDPVVDSNYIEKFYNNYSGEKTSMLLDTTHHNIITKSENFNKIISHLLVNLKIEPNP